MDASSPVITSSRRAADGSSASLTPNQPSEPSLSRRRTMIRLPGVLLSHPPCAVGIHLRWRLRHVGLDFYLSAEPHNAVQCRGREASEREGLV